MRRITTALAALTAAGALALAPISPALAANGVLVLNGEALFDPSGCFDSDRWPLAVENHTDGVVIVFDEPGCGGPPSDFVYPGGSTVSEFGQSVYIH
ncbi:hypothetical protein SAMN05444920_120140 [Nonomuraea solani]|uniref:Secreted protein n=1 Tax=Nonomuraea solani TaxID=1144553 RepID=A0A1H6EWR8_9ACTN|nr:hypothetical protein [Nonomuraea solani]SEH01436.1 hypothetical protein SAMN05444920_120140 [Nonomuraea solani]